MAHRKPKPQFTTGQSVRFHPIIGGPDDGKNYTIRLVGLCSTVPVAWLNEYSGCVALKALSLAPLPNKEKPC